MIYTAELVRYHLVVSAPKDNDATHVDTTLSESSSLQEIRGYSDPPLGVRSPTAIELLGSSQVTGGSS